MKRKWTAWLLSISMIAGTVISPLQSVKAQAKIVTGSESSATEDNRISPVESENLDNGLDVQEIAEGSVETQTQTPSAEPLGTVQPSKSPSVTFPAGVSSATPSTSPAVSASPTPTETVVTSRPIMTAVPGASPLLGDKTVEKVCLYVGNSGRFDIDRSSNSDFFDYSLDKLVEVEYSSSDTELIQLDKEGNYKALAPGKATVKVTGYREYEDWDGDWKYVYNEETGEYESKYYETVSYYKEQLFYEYYYVYIYPDMSGVTLEKDSATVYLVGNYDTARLKIKVNSDYKLDEDDDVTTFSVASSNKKMDFYIHLNSNVLELNTEYTGTTNLTITINGKEFTFHMTVIKIDVSETSVLMREHTTKQLKVKGYSGKLNWKSSRSKVATVNAKGKIRAKKKGNAIIWTKIDGVKIGCIVSVASKKTVKAIKRAQKIASTSKYSQAKRMQSGYYDCSSLVWRSYKSAGINVASSGYAPTAADMAKWLAGKKRLLKGGLSYKNVKNLKVNAGDLMFETGANNGRFKGIYHVEMFIGYAFYGFNSKGEPIVASKWANRYDGYYGYGKRYLVGKM